MFKVKNILVWGQNLIKWEVDNLVWMSDKENQANSALKIYKYNH